MGRTGVLTVLASAAALAAGVVVAPSPRAAATPAPATQPTGFTFTLDQTADLRDGQTVGFEVTGLPQAPTTVLEIAQCDDPVAPGAPLEEIRTGCTSLFRWGSDGQPALGATIDVREVYELHPPEGGFTGRACADEPFDCSIVAYVEPPTAAGPVWALSAVPVDIVPSPLHVAGPGIGDPAVRLEVRLFGEPGAVLRLAQCVRYPEVEPGLANCVPGAEVVLSPEGRGFTTTEVTPVQQVGGRVFDCRLRPCEVTAFDPAGAVVASAKVPGSVDAAVVTLDRTTGLASGSVLHARIETRGGGLYLAQCVAGVLEGTPPSVDGCALLYPGLLFGPDPIELDVTVRDRIAPASGAPEIACADDPGGCIVGFGLPSGETAWYAPISFAGPAELTLTPASGLLDGQDMVLDASGLAAGERYVPVRCVEPPGGGVACERVAGAGPVEPSPEGTATVTVPASQRMFDWGPYYCRDRCSIGLTLEATGDPRPTPRAGYAMADGSIAASPATGLSDGQAVTVTGTGLMSTYPGPPFWFVGTGAWGLAQCDRAVVDDPTLSGVFTHCAAPPPGGPVGVPGSTFTAEVEVAATIDRILGGTTDCAAEPGACVLALGRIEQDGSASVHAVPLGFGGG